MAFLTGVGILRKRITKAGEALRQMFQERWKLCIKVEKCIKNLVKISFLNVLIIFLS